MSETKTRLPADQVLPYAQRLLEALQPGCSRIFIAGSLRRKKSHVGDIELVAEPIFDENLFDEAGEATSALDACIRRESEVGLIRMDEEVKRNGPRYKRFRFTGPDAPDIPAELFLADRSNFGAIFVIRTGDAEFSEALMTPRAKGGLMPGDLVQTKGYLWRFKTQSHAFEYREVKKDHPKEAAGLLKNAGCLFCPDERIYFKHLLLEYLEPEERNKLGIERLKRGVPLL